MAGNLPDVIDVDVTKLAIGQNVKVGDLSVNNVEFLDNKSSVVASVIVTRAAKSAGTENAEEEVGEGEESSTEEAASEE